MDSMDQSIIELDPDQVEDLNQPFGLKEAMDANRLGFAMALSESGLTPGQFEDLCATANFDSVKVAGWLESIANSSKALAALTIGAGAIAGGYSGYARAQADQTIEGNDDPEIVGLRKRIMAYRNMTSDLHRTNGLTANPAA